MTINEKAKIVCDRILELLNEKGRITVAIDGRCASGTTSLALEISKKLECNVFHMDDFFLRPEQRSEERLKTPGENVDHERFLSEVLLPISMGREVSYRPYDCHKGALGDEIKKESKRITIVEGSYSCHVKLCNYYDLRVFSDVEEEEQIRRIIARNGKHGAEMFRSRWIPLEELYFENCRIRDKCDIYLR